MSKRAAQNTAQNVVQMDVSMIECSLSVPWSVRNDAIWVAEHMRRRHLLLREEELAECSSGLCVLMMSLKWACENMEKVHSMIHQDEFYRDTPRDFHRSLIVTEFDRLMSCILTVRSQWNPKWSSERALGVIARAGIGILHRACEEGAIDPVVWMHQKIESDPLWGAALRQNRERDAAL